ncbi:MAG TPA: hypothetical protein VMX79_04430 [bacterium]|nr:hypothetical protein [bacterium]
MKTNTTGGFAAVCLTAILLGAASYAQQPPEDTPPEREAVRAAINEIKQKNVVDVLELEDGEEETFLGVYNRWEEVRWRYRERRGALMEELRLAIAGSDARPVAEILDDVDAVDAESRGSEDRLRAEFRSLLSDDQYARLLLFEHNFNRTLRRFVQEQQRQPPGPATRQP